MQSTCHWNRETGSKLRTCCLENGERHGGKVQESCARRTERRADARIRACCDWLEADTPAVPGWRRCRSAPSFFTPLAMLAHSSCSAPPSLRLGVIPPSPLPNVPQPRWPSSHALSVQQPSLSVPPMSSWSFTRAKALEHYSSLMRKRHTRLSSYLPRSGLERALPSARSSVAAQRAPALPYSSLGRRSLSLLAPQRHYVRYHHSVLSAMSHTCLPVQDTLPLAKSLSSATLSSVTLFF